MMLFDACQGSVLALGFSPDGERLLISGKDRTLNFWSPPMLEREMPTKGREVPCFAYSSDGTMLALATNERGIYLHRFSDGEFIPLPRFELGVTGLAFMQNDQSLAVSLGDRLSATFANPALHLINLTTRRASGIRDAHNGIRSLSVHDRKRLIAWSTDSRTVAVRDLTRSTLYFEKRLAVEPRKVALSPDGHFLAVAMDWRTEIYSFEKRLEIITLTGHKGIVTSLAFTPDGKRLLTGSWDQTVKVWDMATGEELASFNWQIGRIVDLAIAPDGLRAAVGSDQGQTAVWDLE